MTTAAFPSALGDSAALPMPQAGSVLAVTARPGTESEKLGALLYAFRRAGARLSLLCLSRGEASAQNCTVARLESVRPWELQVAATVLGVGSVTVGNYPDGDLAGVPGAELTGRVRRAIRDHAADLLLVIAPEAGDSDDGAVARAVQAAATQAGVPAVARTWPGAPGAWLVGLGAGAVTARAVQRSAVAAHVSQSAALSAVLRRLDLLDDREPLRWLEFPRQVPARRKPRLDGAGSLASVLPAAVPASSGSPAVPPAARRRSSRTDSTATAASTTPMKAGEAQAGRW